MKKELDKLNDDEIIEYMKEKLFLECILIFGDEPEYLNLMKNLKSLSEDK